MCFYVVEKDIDSKKEYEVVELKKCGFTFSEPVLLSEVASWCNFGKELKENTKKT